MSPTGGAPGELHSKRSLLGTVSLFPIQRRCSVLRRKVSFLYLGSLFFTGIALGADAIPNWSAPASWSPTRAAGLRTLSDATPPLPFIGLPPCRILDTRGNGAPIQGGIFTGGSDVRNYTIPPICGVPSGVSAVSLNFTVTGPGQTTAGFLLAWPTGGAVPPVSILNWDRPQQQIANAAVVPTNGSGSITVNVSAPTHLIMDINGYYANTPATAINGFVIFNSGIAIFGSTNSTISGASGVLGQATATSGNVFGVSGSTSSTASTSAGVSGSGPVSGVVGTCTGPGCAGVFGESFVT